MNWTTFKLQYGYNYINTLDLKDYVTDFQGGLPDKKITIFDKLTDGAIISKRNYLSNYKAKLTIVTLGQNINLRNVFLKIADLPYHIPKKLVRYQIIDGVNVVDELTVQIEMISGEKFSGGYATSEFDVNFVSEESFFIDQIIKQQIYTLSGPASQFILHNDNFRTYGLYQLEITSGGDCDFIELKLYEGWGFRLDYVFNVGDIIIVEMNSSELNVYLNGGLIQNICSSNSAPFEIMPDDNLFYYRGGDCVLTISYYETRL